MSEGMVGPTSDTGGTAPEAEAAQASAPGCPDVDQALVDQGRSVFTGAGGCAACHAADATGTQLGPNLTDREWLDAGGSYGSIAATVRSGVPSPRRYPAPMPALGGAQLTTAQVCAVAAYVYSRSH
jgi:mono/diheme cytochrome c family protein